jgi:formate dehydrogenase subunit gamma
MKAKDQLTRPGKAGPTRDDLGAGRVLRFTGTERLLHWAFVIPFLVLLVTGVMLALPDLEVLLAQRDVVRSLHLAAAWGMVVLPLLVVVAGDRRALLRDLHEIDYWDGLDFQWLWRAPVFFMSKLPPAGRFNAGQKVNAIVVAAAAIGFLVTGLAMWKAELFPLWLGDVSTQLHDLLTVLIVPLIAGHLFLTLLNPSTRGSLRGIVTGYVDAAWAAAHHPRWKR